MNSHGPWSREMRLGVYPGTLSYRAIPRGMPDSSVEKKNTRARPRNQSRSSQLVASRPLYAPWNRPFNSIVVPLPRGFEGWQRGTGRVASKDGEITYISLWNHIYSFSNTADIYVSQRRNLATVLRYKSRFYRVSKKRRLKIRTNVDSSHKYFTNMQNFDTFESSRM